MSPRNPSACSLEKSARRRLPNAKVIVIGAGKDGLPLILGGQ